MRVCISQFSKCWSVDGLFEWKTAKYLCKREETFIYNTSLQFRAGNRFEILLFALFLFVYIP